MKTRPILFSAPMVRALMEERKTQTRRVVKPQPQNLPHGFSGTPSHDVFCGGARWKCPYGQPGDLLWVRESVCDTAIYSDLNRISKNRFRYAADGKRNEWRYKPSIHMPRIASRLTLEIINVKIEKLRMINEPDAIAEGFLSEDDFHDYWFEINPVSDFCVQGDAEDDPWVWVVEFKVHRCNVDALLKERAA